MHYFSNYFDKELYMFRTDLLSIIRSLNTVLTAIGICHASSVGCLLAVASWVAPTKFGHRKRSLWSRCWGVKLTSRHHPEPSLITRDILLFSPYAFHGMYSYNVTLSGTSQRLHFSTQTTCISLSCRVGTS